MAEWITVSVDPQQTRLEKNLRGVNVDVYVSPYDVPEAARGFYNKQMNCLIIEFKYIGDETKKREKLNQNISVLIGENSRRLYAIEVDAHALARTMELRVNFIRQALQHLAEKPESKERQENYNLIRSIIASKQKELLESAP